MQKCLREYLCYEPDGTLWWAKNPKPFGVNLTGRKAGTRRQGAWWVLTLKGVHMRLGRAVWIWHHGEVPAGFEVCHRDGDPDNNRIENLMLMDRSVSTATAAPCSNNTSGYRGVSWCRDRSRWYAYIKHNARMISLGRHTNLDDAVAARRSAEQRLFPGGRPREHA